MPDSRDKARPVTLDLYTLEMWGLQGSGYSVRLDGDVDDIWADSFTQTQRTKGDTTRFYLDRKRCVLVFSTAIGEDPQKLLTEARALLDLTNRRTGRRARPRPENSAAPAADENAQRSEAPGTSGKAEMAKKSSQQRLEDTRGCSRASASLMVEFCAEGEEGDDSTLAGMTRDLSETGVFVVTSRLPSVGERVNLTVHLAAKERIDMTGEVVRVLDRDKARQMQLRGGFAARVTDPSGRYSVLVARSQA